MDPSPARARLPLTYQAILRGLDAGRTVEQLADELDLEVASVRTLARIGAEKLVALEQADDAEEIVLP